MAYKQRGTPLNDSFNTRFSGALMAFLRAHAFRRDVTIPDLVRCILTSWVRRATPMDDPIFSISSIGYNLPTPVDDENYYPGFVASLRFLPESEVTPPVGKR